MNLTPISACGCCNRTMRLFQRFFAYFSLIFSIGLTQSCGKKLATTNEVEPIIVSTLDYALGEDGLNFVYGDTIVPLSPETQKNVALCKIADPLPAGLYFDKATCTLFGTPQRPVGSTQNLNGVFRIQTFASSSSTTPSSSKEIPFIIVQPKPILNFGSDLTKTVGSPIQILNAASAASGPISTCSITPNLPPGLSINSTTCAITGTVSSAQSPQSYEVDATGAGGVETASFTLAFAFNAPSLSYDNVPANLIVGNSANIVPNKAGVDHCSISPALPTGLAFDPSSCTISGTPSESSEALSYEITAYPGPGNSSPSTNLTISFGVKYNAPFLLYSNTPTVLEVGTEYSLSPITKTGVNLCSISPPLPPGLGLNSSTCVISGTPNAPSSITLYTVTAFPGSAGSTPTSMTSFSFYVRYNAPILNYNAVPNSIIGTPYTLSPSSAVGVNHCSIAPPLSAGLSLNTSTCVISGTPTATSALTIYTVTAFPGPGDSTPTNVSYVNLATGYNAPTFSYNTTPTTANIGAPFSLSPSSVVGVDHCSVSPALPAGLTLNTSTCVISGTPTTPTALLSYTVTAFPGPGNSTPTIASSFTLVISYPTPTFSYSIAPSYFNIGTAYSLIPNSKNGVDHCSIIPALPAGLNLDTSTCVISGSPTAASPLLSYTVTAFPGPGNSTPTSSSTFTLGSSYTAPTFAYNTPPTTSNIGTPYTLSPSSKIGVHHCSISPPLPAGLSFNVSSCVVSGTPTTPSVLTNYTVTAFPGPGDSSPTVPSGFTLAISYVAPTLSYPIPTAPLVGVPYVLMPTSKAGVDHCSINAPLPEGLSLNPSTCVISGTATTYAAASLFTVWAYPGPGSSSTPKTDATFILNVNYKIPYFSYPAAPAAEVGVPYSLTPSTRSGVDHCSVSPALPPGLTLNTSNCVISGTPLNLSGAGSYTVVAYPGPGNSTPTESATINLAVTPTPVFALPTTPGSFDPSIGTAFVEAPNTIIMRSDTNIGSAIVPTLGSNPIVSCTATPPLLPGLVLAPNCAISGTPQGAFGLHEHTLNFETESGFSGSTLINIDLRCHGILPIGHNYERPAEFTSAQVPYQGYTLSTNSHQFTPGPIVTPSPQNESMFPQGLLAVGSYMLASSSYSIPGQVTIFKPGSSCQWEKVQTIHAPTPIAADAFGASVSLVGGRLVVGAPGTTFYAPSTYAVNKKQGAAYVYELGTSGTFEVRNTLIADNGAMQLPANSAPSFGSFVTQYMDKVAVSAPFEASCAFGVDDASTTQVCPGGVCSSVLNRLRLCETASTSSTSLSARATLGAVYIYQVDGESSQQVHHIKSYSRYFDQSFGFGYKVHLDDNNLIINAPYNRAPFTGVNNPEMYNMEELYRTNTWQQIAALNMPYTQGGAVFHYKKDGQDPTWSLGSLIRSDETLDKASPFVSSFINSGTKFGSTFDYDDQNKRLLISEIVALDINTPYLSAYQKGSSTFARTGRGKLLGEILGTGALPSSTVGRAIAADPKRGRVLIANAWNGYVSSSTTPSFGNVFFAPWSLPALISDSLTSAALPLKSFTSSNGRAFGSSLAVKGDYIFTHSTSGLFWTHAGQAGNFATVAPVASVSPCPVGSTPILSNGNFAGCYSPGGSSASGGASASGYGFGGASASGL